jgi:HD superfamily phosphohydrolase
VKLTQNKKKLINDPVYGFISIPNDFIFDLIEHPWFQRLRRIRQLGLTDYVYPGANHSRYHHALGALHLMQLAVSHLRSRGNDITDEEENGVYAAILLHDIGHGPFSHALEHAVIPDWPHEKLSLLIMHQLNTEFQGKLDVCIAIFQNSYPKKFLHQLVSSQLDMDRLDYLNRDSFFTGVVEGSVGSERIIKMLDVVNDGIVVQEKGIYSIEKFLIARRLMYWQVYLHKTVLSAENLLVGTLMRARQLAQQNQLVFASTALHYFLVATHSTEETGAPIEDILRHFAALDDYDIFAAAKEWMHHSDPILSQLSSRLIHRDLLRIHLDNEPFSPADLDKYRNGLFRAGFSEEALPYFVFTGKITNSAYKDDENKINVMLKDGRIAGLNKVADQLHLSVLTNATHKYFLCYPKELESN